MNMNRFVCIKWHELWSGFVELLVDFSTLISLFIATTAMNTYSLASDTQRNKIEC